MSTKNHDAEFEALQAELRKQIEAHMQEMEQQHNDAATKILCAKLNISEENFPAFVADMDAVRNRIYIFVGTGAGISEYMTEDNAFNAALFDEDFAKIRRLSQILIELESEREKEVDTQILAAELLEGENDVEPDPH